MVLMAAEAASQGLVIGVGSAIVALLGLLMAAVYKMVDGMRDDIKTLRTEVGTAIATLDHTTSLNFAGLRNDLSALNREMGEVKVRLEYGYVPGKPAGPGPRRPAGA